MKLKTILAAGAAVLASSAIALGAVNFTQKDTGAFCFNFLSGITNTESWCWSSAGNLTIDDGTTDAPTVTFQDGTDETLVFTKLDGSHFTMTITAADAVQVLTGNLRVGNGTPGETHNGEDLYVEGISEFDGTANFDGAVDFDSTIDFSGAISTNADVTILTPGDLIVGNGSPGVAQNGEDGYIEGTFEVDGAAQFDGAVAATSTLAVTGVTTQTGQLDVVDDVKIGNGTPGVTLNGEDLYVEGTSEFDGAMQVDGAVTATSTITTAGNANDVTLALPTNGGNADADNQFIGIPKIAGWSVGISLNGTTTGGVVSVDFNDETPAGEWVGTTNVTDATDSSIYRKGTASLSLAVIDAAVAGNGADNTLAGGDQDWTDDESFGFWHRCDQTTTAGDWVLEITDSVAGATTVNVPALTVANQWQWVEVNISGVANTSKDVITTIGMDLSTAGAALSTITCYFDYMYKWDAAGEEALGQDILEDGILAIWANPTASATAMAVVIPVETTDYFIHYEAGNDFLVVVTDQSAQAIWGMAALE